LYVLLAASLSPLGTELWRVEGTNMTKDKEYNFLLVDGDNNAGCERHITLEAAMAGAEDLAEDYGATKPWYIIDTRKHKVVRVGLPLEKKSSFQWKAQ
jgi:hypothetical protein